MLIDFLLHAMVALLVLANVTPAYAIMGGDEKAVPSDTPSKRLDPQGAASQFNAVGALAISSGGFNYKGSGVALSPNWVLTAGHNLDLNDNGQPDPGLAISFNLPGFGAYSASTFYTCPRFTGFGNPSIQRDLGLLYFATPLPNELLFPSLSSSLQIGDQITLVGFGRSGYGSYGYTTSASLTDRRIGWNIVDSFTIDDLGGGFPVLFRYDFDSPDTTGKSGGSLGNAVESLIAPGDSGGPVLVQSGSSFALAGISTFVEGYGGRFGDIGGAILVQPYLSWIGDVTGLVVPEPSEVCLLSLGFAWLFRRVKRFDSAGGGGRCRGAAKEVLLG